ncbi:hypothetical protein HNY73_004033 [Argiope bruennichi]|uniref:Uncharacterized protein n=1 Tax=Argiope bruennichi TaxID=94029 RepID=A0A8T0FN03_ARGBR|nr:hypothetical protein HNY73_004033 [Argiope bruennichi]
MRVLPFGVSVESLAIWCARWRIGHGVRDVGLWPFGLLWSLWPFGVRVWSLWPFGVRVWSLWPFGVRVWSLWPFGGECGVGHLVVCGSLAFGWVWSFGHLGASVEFWAFGGCECGGFWPLVCECGVFGHLVCECGAFDLVVRVWRLWPFGVRVWRLWPFGVRVWRLWPFGVRVWRLWPFGVRVWRLWPFGVRVWRLWPFGVRVWRLAWCGCGLAIWEAFGLGVRVWEVGPWFWRVWRLGHLVCECGGFGHLGVEVWRLWPFGVGCGGFGHLVCGVVLAIGGLWGFGHWWGWLWALRGVAIWWALDLVGVRWVWPFGLGAVWLWPLAVRVWGRLWPLVCELGLWFVGCGGLAICVRLLEALAMVAVWRRVGMVLGCVERWPFVCGVEAFPFDWDFRQLAFT